MKNKMKDKIFLYKRDFSETWTLIVQFYNFWNNTNRKGLAYVSGTKTQIKEFVKMIIPRAMEVLDVFPNEFKFREEVNQLKSLLRYL